MPQLAYRKYDDFELIDEYMNTQNQLYFNELYGRYADKIYGKCLSILRDATAAQDAAQDIFMKVFLKLASFNRKSKFSTWVYSITYNYCIDIVRKNKRLVVSSMDSDIAPEIADTSPEMSDAAFREMNIGRLSKALDDIPETDKALLILKYQDGLSIKELAEVTGKGESAVKMKLKRAKAKAQHAYQNLVISILIIIALWMNR